MLKSIPDKAFLGKLEPFFLPTIVVLVGLCAFGLGRLSAGEAAGPRLIINTPQTAAAVLSEGSAQSVSTTTGSFVASKSGTKYYSPNCSGASRIKEENKVWFQSAAAALAAGYEPASNCPGL